MRIQVIYSLVITILVSVSSFTVNTRDFTTFKDVGRHFNMERISPLQMSFVADSSDYKSSDSEYDSDEDAMSGIGVPVKEGDEDDSPTIEETPVPMSKNSGNRFIALVFDRSLSSISDDEDSVLELHENRIALTEDHVMFCRKANLYNETFNTESMADIVWSHQM